MSTERSNLLAQLAAPGTVVNGKYRIERVIGEGGMGIVVEAWHLDFDERVAIKFLMPALGASPEAVLRFEREARVLFKIKSPHVCRVLDVGRLEAGSPFLVLEFLEGEDLANKLTHRKGSALEDAIDWVVEACDAVSEAHARGIVHRDIKPENLFLARMADGNFRVKVLDFGLSKIASAGPVERQRALTSTEQSMGTPHYMSPEQWLSARDVGPASDQWALAIILYELLLGVPPFDGEQIAQVCSTVLHAPMPPIVSRAPHVPQAVEDALRRALEKDPANRFENLGGFVTAIAPYGRSESRAIAARIVRMFEQADQLLKSAEMARLSQASLAAIAASYPGIAAPTTNSEVSSPTPAIPPSHGAAAVPAAVPPNPGRDAMPRAEVAVSPAPTASPWLDLSGEFPNATGARRHQTAQSWQQHLVAERPSVAGPAARRTGLIAFLAALAVLAVVALLVGPRIANAVRASSSPTLSPAPPASSSLEHPTEVSPVGAVSAASSSPIAEAAPSAQAELPARGTAMAPAAASAAPHSGLAPSSATLHPVAPAASGQTKFGTPSYGTTATYGTKLPKGKGSIFDSR